MRTLSDTLTRLTALRNAQFLDPRPAGNDRLTDITPFGSNPGALGARAYVPAALQKGAALVVVLHGCTQTAADYDRGSGWSDLAERHGFAVLFPEQQRSNNPNLCFNWFVHADIQREGGEAQSIRQMVDRVCRDHGIDRRRVFVTGLSAGGAMAAVMLATYPDVFAGGGVIAGLPYGSADTVPEALDRMRGHGAPSAPQLTAVARAASRHQGPWPTLSVWHGSADRTVDATNATAIVGQWRGLHGLAETPDETITIDGHVRRTWTDAKGRFAIEDYRIAGMGHGTPLDTLDEDGVGVPGAYMLEAGISSTRHLAARWGLTPPLVERTAARARQRPITTMRPTRTKAVDIGTVRPSPRPRSPHPTHATNRIGKVIEDALRAAGLMR